MSVADTEDYSHQNQGRGVGISFLPEIPYIWITPKMMLPTLEEGLSLVNLF